MPKIFLCYRREDSKWPAQWIYNHLADHFGSESVVFDIDTIPLGADFREYLNVEVSKCDIFLTVMGDQWLDILKERIEEPNDFVRIEIEIALRREIPVVPILVGGNSVPSEKDLPPELAKLSYKQAAEVRAGADLRVHLKRLIDGLDRLVPDHKIGKELKQKQVDEELKREETSERYTNSIDMEFVLIPAGKFMMGSKFGPEEVAQKYGDNAKWFKFEFPQHKVTISKQFYLQSTTVTQGQWKKVMRDTPSKFNDCGNDCPVENVSWDMAQEFIKKLNGMEGIDKYRLPTEAEWEYAARAGTTTEFSFGDDAGQLGKYAWFSENSDKNTHSVMTKKPNPLGLYDIHGNVYEWTEDEWHDNYEDAPTDGRAWVDKSRGSRRVFRGGCWEYDARHCRSANRNGDSPGYRSPSVGFRLAMSISLSP